MQATATVEISKQADVMCAFGVVQFKDFKMSVYSFFVDGVLIDTGSVSMLKELIPFFRNLQIERVVMTHNHEDHIGCSKWIQDQLAVPLYIHENAVNRCQEPFIYKKYRQIMWGQAEPFTAMPIEKTFSSRNETWEVIYTPGHSDDHICLYNVNRKVLFTGDLFVQVRTKVILEGEQILKTMASLEKVLSYEFEEVFCNHAGYLSNGRLQLQQKLDYLRALYFQIQQLRSEGKEIEEIAAELFPKNYPIVTVSEGEWGAHHLVASMLT